MQAEARRIGVAVAQPLLDRNRVLVEHPLAKGQARLDIQVRCRHLGGEARAELVEARDQETGGCEQLGHDAVEEVEGVVELRRGGVVARAEDLAGHLSEID